MKPQSSLNSAAQPKSKVAAAAAPAAQVSSHRSVETDERSYFLQVKDRPCYMNSLMTESFFTMYVRAVLLVRWDAEKL